jgi:hypothetical protein
MINGMVYDFESIKCLLPTGMSIMLEKISYSDKKGDEVVYGINNLPVGIGRGEYSGECEIEFGRIEYDLLNAFSATSGGFYNMPPIPVVVSYGQFGQVPVTDVLVAHFTERKFDGSKGDTNLTVSIKGALTAPIISNGVPAYVPLVS